MKIESFEAPRYSANVNAESRMICDWKYNEVCLELWVTLEGMTGEIGGG